MLPLRGVAVFPGSRVPLQVGRPLSLRAVAAAAAGDGRLLVCAQRDPQCDEPGAGDLHAVGSVAVLREARGEQAGTVRVIVEGLWRARVRAFVPPGPAGPAACALAEVEVLGDDVAEQPAEPELRELAQALLRRLERLRAVAGEERVGGDAPLPPPEEPGRLCDAIAARVLQRAEERQEILEAVGLRQRLTRLHRILTREAEQGAVERAVAARVRSQMEHAQREHYLREQLRAIRRELGEESGEGPGEGADLRARLAAGTWPEPVRERASRELDRLERLPALSAEAAVARTHIEWLLALPWTERVAEDTDLRRAERVLEQDHHGLGQVRERVLEHLALRRLRAAAGRPAGGGGAVLCLVGPPGVGKTSVARSVARALGRPFVRLSLGGVRDEAEIRGHRRTYVGALPGRLLHGLRQAGVKNPLLLLDELDKLGADQHGDPAAALLEVLDPEQNAQFTDHYLEVPFDLSEVLFVATANTLAPLPRPLRDRLEVIELPGYDAAEKLAIARRHLLPRQLAESALPQGALRVTDGALRALILQYTREAGVRALEREIAALCRRAARLAAADPAAQLSVTARNLPDLLGRPRVVPRQAPPRDEVGVATGLAWTETGGEVLAIEVGVLPGQGHLQLTGSLGEVMRESAQAALTFIRCRAAALGIPPDLFARVELHVHAPEGAVPKDGPSAGITLAAAMVSALVGRPVHRDVALTGEITLRGRILPVGGIREKALAAARAGSRRLVLPAANRADWDGVASAVAGLEPVFVQRAEEALAAALVGGRPAALAEPVGPSVAG